MELIVKIGADQAGLQQTVSRMKEQFKDMNMSVPASWDSASAGRSWNRVAQRGGMTGGDGSLGGLLGAGLMAGGKGAGGLLGKVTIGRIAAGFLGGNLLTLIIEAARKALDAGSASMSKTFWERIYGVDEPMMQRVARAHAELKRHVKELAEARRKEADAAEHDILTNASPKGQEQILDRKVKEARAALAQAEKDREYAYANRKEATGALGAPLSAEQAAKLTDEAAKAEKKVLDAQGKVRDLENQHKKVLSELTMEGVTRDREAEEKRQSAIKSRADYGRASFEADALARTGLFAGSSLLMNPDFSMEQEQVRLLSEINSTLKRGDFI